MAFSPFSPAHAALPRGVSTTVGETALTVMPWRAHSSESTCVRPMTAALLAQYAACWSSPMTAACEARLMMRPYPASSITRPAACAM